MKIDKEDIVRTGNLQLLAKKAVEGFITGLHKSPFHGFSVEFAEHRSYNPGDSIRNIDWKLFARTEKMFVKRYEEETNLRCHIIIDSSSSMKWKPEGVTLSKYQFSIWSAAVLLQVLKKQRDAGSLAFISDRIEEITPVRSSLRHYQSLFQNLEIELNKTDIGVQTDFGNQLYILAEKIHRRSLVIIFSDFFDKDNDVSTIIKALQHLKFKKNEVIVFNTIHQDLEMEFDFENRPTTFEDIETGAKIKLNPQEVREAYKNSVSEYFKDIKSQLLQYKIDFNWVDTKGAVGEILLPFLVKREKMSR
jgi:uncharacterized protein (DUF58 family)